MNTRDRLAEALEGQLVYVNIQRGVPVSHPHYSGWLRGGGRELADALLPVVEQLMAERAAEAVKPFEELFSGGPDTVCRTSWREDPHRPECSAAAEECCEVPMADLRDAFARAAGLTDKDGQR